MEMPAWLRMLDSVPGRTRLCIGTMTVLLVAVWRSLQWEPLVWISMKPARLQRSLEPCSRDLREAPRHAGIRTLIGRTIGGVGTGSASK